MYEAKVRFEVPPGAADDVRAALEMAGGPCDESVLSARYFDTPETLFAVHGASLRLRREAGQWIQTFNAGTTDLLTRLEYSLPLADAQLNLAPILEREGARWLGDIEQGQRVLSHLQTRFETSVERARSVVSARSGSQNSTIELRLETGELRAGANHLPIVTLEFELLNGAMQPMLMLAAHWQQRFALIFQPVERAVLGEWLARGQPFIPPRRARSVTLTRDVSVGAAWRLLFDECFTQIAENCWALAGGHAEPEHRHQCRVAIRRLRSLLRLFDGWTTPLPDDLALSLAQLGRDLGADRDMDVFRLEILPRLRAAGCGGLGHRLEQSAPTVQVDSTCVQAQSLLLQLLIWRYRSNDGPKAEYRLRPLLRGRLRKWLKRVQRGARRFDQMDEGRRHQLRRRIKRLRYASEMTRDLLPDGTLKQLKTSVLAQQTRLGSWCDLRMARALISQEPLSDENADSLRFALGWIAGQLDALEPQLSRSIGQSATRKIRL